MKQKHKHHIIPKHIGGTDSPDNIVELTIEEHAEAHRKLFEEHGRWQDEIAWKSLSGMLGGKKAIMKEFWKENGRRTTGYKMSEYQKEQSRLANKGKKLTEEHKAKIVGWGRKQPQRQKDLVADANSMKWIVETPEGKKERVYNLCEYGRKHNLGNAWQGNCVKHGHSLGYRVQRVSQTKSTATSGYRTRGKNLTL
jgi:hypothetical protein